MAWGGGMFGGAPVQAQRGSPGNPGGGLPFAGIPPELQSGVDTIVFADGTIWDRTRMSLEVVDRERAAGNYNDPYIGSGSSDILWGGKGNDYLSGGAGGDIRAHRFLQVSGRIERVHVYAVGHLACHPQHPRVDGSHVDGRRGHANGAGSPLPWQQREPVEVAFEVDGLPAEAGAQEGDELAHLGERALAVAGAVPAAGHDR